MTQEKISIGFSPCPNDTYIFEALVHGRISSPLTYQPVITEVETLNRLAQNSVLDVTKLSFNAFYQVEHQYNLLDAGSALGNGVGPLFISLPETKEKPLKDWTVALPGKQTTAHLLFSLAYPYITSKKYMLFHEIEDEILLKKVDAGVIIHENRFTYERKGLTCIRDLGTFWEEKYKVPIPLGGIAAHNRLGQDLIKQIQLDIYRSLRFANENPSISQEFIAFHAQEMDPAIRQKHIQTYVNSYSLSLGKEGRHAIDIMRDAALTLAVDS